MIKPKESLKSATVVSYITVLLNIASAIIITPLIIEVLGLSTYGLYTIFGGIILILSYLDLGIGNATTRFTAKYKDISGEFDKFITNVLFLSIIICSLIFIIATFIYINFDFFFEGKFTEAESTIAANLFFYLSINLCLSVVNNVFIGFCSGSERFLFPRKLKILNVVIRFFCIYFLIHEFKTIYLIVFISTILNLFLLLALYWYLTKSLSITLKLNYSKINFFSIKGILNFSLWLFIYSTAFSMLWELGKILSGLFLGTEQAALYGLAVMLSGYASFLSVTITSMYLPLAIKFIENKESQDNIEKVNIYLGRVSIIVFSYVIFGFVLIGEDFIKMWLGSGFDELYTLTLIMMIAFVLPLTQHFSSHLLEAQGLIKYKAIYLLFFISVGFITLTYIYEYLGLISFALIPMVSLQLFQLSQMVLYKLKLKINVMHFIFHTYFCFIPFVIIMSFEVYYINGLELEGALGFLIKGGLFTLFFIITLYLYTKLKFIGWFNINSLVSEISNKKLNKVGSYEN